ncbi:MAG: bacteriocin-like protein [Chryseobacterium culicis]
MKNLKKMKRNELKNVKGGDNPTRVVCIQLMNQFVEAFPEDFCYNPENSTHTVCVCKRLYGL